MRPALFAAAWTSGQQLPLQQAVDEALQVTELGDTPPRSIAGKRVERASGRRTRVRGEPDLLTAREREVAELVRRGLTNRQIGEALVITEGTAALHVKNALSKLGFTSRAQLASWATERRELSIP
jgi:DNA-binding NarL/FixJ family response regulator